jgi:hypothetical protein
VVKKRKRKTRMTKVERALLYRALMDCLELIPHKDHPQAATDAMRKYFGKKYDRERLRWMHWAAVKEADQHPDKPWQSKWLPSGDWPSGEIYERARTLLLKRPIAADVLSASTIRDDYLACEKIARKLGDDLVVRNAPLLSH